MAWIDPNNGEKSDHADQHEDTKATDVNHESSIQKCIVNEEGIFHENTL